MNGARAGEAEERSGCRSCAGSSREVSPQPKAGGAGARGLCPHAVLPIAGRGLGARLSLGRQSQTPVHTSGVMLRQQQPEAARAHPVPTSPLSAPGSLPAEGEGLSLPAAEPAACQGVFRGSPLC